MSQIIYALECEAGKYYIGKTSDLEARYQEHLSSEGSAWTSKYRPKKIKATYAATSNFDEDRYTLEYMSKYGIDNVRGGSFSTLEITPQQREQISAMLKTAYDKCFKCGESGHFANDCNSTVTQKDTAFNEDRVREFLRKQGLSPGQINALIERKNRKDRNVCHRCGRSGHYADACYANKHQYDVVTCYRCGHPGHYANECYARKDVNGYYL